MESCLFTIKQIPDKDSNVPSRGNIIKLNMSKQGMWSQFQLCLLKPPLTSCIIASSHVSSMGIPIIFGMICLIWSAHVTHLSKMRQTHNQILKILQIFYHFSPINPHLLDFYRECTHLRTHIGLCLVPYFTNGQKVAHLSILSLTLALVFGTS